MAKRRSKRRAHLNSIVTILVAVVVVFCVYSSWSDKNGRDNPLLSIKLPSLSSVEELIDDFIPESYPEEIDNAVAVSSTLAGAKLEVHYIDMGQADSILIKAPEANVLIDAGENNQGAGVIRYLKKQGVNKLDYVIGTHPHSDHIGGLDTVILDMKVSKVILPVIPDDISPTTQTYTDLLQAISDKNLKITAATPGKTLDLGDGAQLEILGPIGEYQDLNNMSVVSRLTYGSNSFLFTGDACTGAENDILTAGRLVRSDVMDVGHHGSNTSTSEAFLEAVSPAIAVISCGKDNSYGHPHREVMERLQGRGVRILRTDINGTIVISSNGDRLGIDTAA